MKTLPGILLSILCGVVLLGVVSCHSGLKKNRYDRCSHFSQTPKPVTLLKDNG